MILDGHIHIWKKHGTQEAFVRDLSRAGVDGGIVFSYQPASFNNMKAEPEDAKRRLDQVLAFTRGYPNLFPFFFIDPMEDSAFDQVDMAVDANIRGFKVICTHHYPQDDRAMDVWTYIAAKSKPILFHSGILYNRGPSAAFNRPGNFEPLLFIKGLRFSMAHASWPWCDEMIAVFGKWNSLFPNTGIEQMAELFVDLTPGTPGIYREEVLGKLVTVGYELLKDHMVFGTDGGSIYDHERYKRLIAGDKRIYERLGLPQKDIEKIFTGNLLSFVGPS